MAGIGEAVYARATELIDGGMTATAAFAQIAQETDSKPGTVSANYYRVARKLGKTSATPRKPRTLTLVEQLDEIQNQIYELRQAVVTVTAENAAAEAELSKLRRIKALIDSED